MIQTVRPYYSGSGIGGLGEDYAVATETWWAKNGGFLITMIGTMLTQWGNRITQEQLNAKIIEAIKTAMGPVEKPSIEKSEELAQALFKLQGGTISIDRAREIINGTVNNAGSEKPVATTYPSWLLPAGIALVLFVLLTRGKGGA